LRVQSHCVNALYCGDNALTRHLRVMEKVCRIFNDEVIPECIVGVSQEQILIKFAKDLKQSYISGDECRPYRTRTSCKV
jgi:hypothetical protein